MPVSAVLCVRANHLIHYHYLSSGAHINIHDIYTIYPILLQCALLQCALSQNRTHAAVLTGLIT